ncbi:MAG: universal stress protein [Candidatus Acidiferrales bacterium]
MSTVGMGARVALRNILYLTDFSEASETALPFAVSIARAYESKVVALHIVTPTTYSPGLVYVTPEGAADAAAAAEELLNAEMQRVDSQLSGLVHETIMIRELSVWPAVERAIAEHGIDFIVLGTHGRTGTMKLLLGSVAEEIFRKSKAPVLTIGPHVRSGSHRGGQFRRILFATDFSAESLVALPYAISFSRENQARLALLHVQPAICDRPAKVGPKESVASILGELHDLVPRDAELWCHPEVMVEYGVPGERIVNASRQHGTELIVLGVRSKSKHLGAALHTGRATAHQVVANADCPVLTIRGG